MLKVHYLHQTGMIYPLICSISSTENSTTPLTSSTSVLCANRGLQLLRSPSTLLNSHLFSSAKVSAHQSSNYIHLTLARLVEFKCLKLAISFCGQSQGYLATYNSGHITLLNPFTKAELSLPFTRFMLCRPLHVGPDPIRNSDDVVMHMTLGYGCPIVWFWKTKDNEWYLKGDLPGRVEAYHKGRLIFSDSNNYTTTIMDLNTGNKLEVSLPSNIVIDDFLCLGEGAGAFLGIQRRFHSCDRYEDWSVENYWFEVYKLDEKQKPPCWVKLSDIGDMMIFLNSNNSGFCLSASDFDGFKGNCIYFTSGPSEEEIHDSRMLIGLYDLGKHKAEMIGELESKGTWIVPNVY